MTYTTDIAVDSHDVGFYLTFDGIETMIGTQDFNATHGISGTFLPQLDVNSLGTCSRTLNRETHIVEEDALSFSVFSTPETLDLFRRRGGTTTRLATGVTWSATTIVLLSATNTYANGATIYAGRETITLGTHGGSGSYTGCTRGAHGSERIALDDGTIISDVPRFWWTRGVSLTAVNLGTGTTKALWFGSLSDAPTYSDGRLVFSTTGRMNDYLMRPIATGWTDYKPASIERPSASVVRCVFADTRDQYQFASSEGESFVRMEIEGKTGIFWFDDADLTSTHLDIDLNNAVPAGVIFGGGGGYQTTFGINFLPEADENPDVTLRQIGIVQGRCGHVALKVALSINGDIANSDPWDCLPGVAPNASSETAVWRRRMGAGLPESRVDVSAWLDILGGKPSDLYWMTEAKNLGDFLAGELMWRTGAYALVDDTGRLSVQSYAPVSVRGSLTTYDAEAVLIAAEVSGRDDEQGAPARARIQANYNPITGDYLRTLDIVWFDDAPIYDRDGSLEISSTAVRLGTGADDYASIEASFDRVRSRRIHSGRRMAYRVPWRFHEILQPASRIAVTDSRMPDFEGSTGITARTVEVVSVTYDFAGLFLIVELEEIPRGWIWAASGIVRSWSSPTLTLNDIALNAGGPGVAANKATEFPYGAPGGAIRVYDASASPPFSVSTTALTITGVSGDALTTSGTPSFTPAAGDLVVMSFGDDDATANDIGAFTRDMAYSANDDGTLTGGVVGPKWG